MGISKKRDKKNILIIFLLIIVFVMSVGFALLGSNLEITATGTVSGDWNVKFSNETMDPIFQTEGAKIVTAQLDSTALKVTLNATFEKPGDKITYEFAIENMGSIDASLIAVNLVGKTGNTEAIKLSYNVKSNDKLSLYAEGEIIGEKQTIIKELIPETSTLSKAKVVDDNKEPQKNYLTVTLEYLENITDVSSEASATYTLNLEYEQTDANSQ